MTRGDAATNVLIATGVLAASIGVPLFFISPPRVFNDERWLQFVEQLCGDLAACNASAATLKSGSSGDRSLHAARRISKGEAAISIPRELILAAQDLSLIHI